MNSGWEGGKQTTLPRADRLIFNFKKLTVAGGYQNNKNLMLEPHTMNGTTFLILK